MGRFMTSTAEMGPFAGICRVLTGWRVGRSHTTKAPSSEPAGGSHAQPHLCCDKVSETVVGLQPCTALALQMLQNLHV